MDHTLNVASGVFSTMAIKIAHAGVYNVTLTRDSYFGDVAVELKLENKEFCKAPVSLTKLELGYLSRGTLSQFIVVHVHNSTINIVATSQSGFTGKIHIARHEEHYHKLASGTKLNNFDLSSNNAVKVLQYKYLHFLAFSHGNHGHAQDFYYIGEQLRCSLSEYYDPKDIYTLYANSYEYMNTHNGIDNCGKSMSQEIIQFYHNYLEARVAADSNIRILFSMYVANLLLWF